VTTIKQFEKELRKAAKGQWGTASREERIVFAVFLAERLLNIERALAKTDGKRPARPKTAWQQFFAEGMKAGKSPQQIATEWRTRKA
jgi:hypothetical protein